MTKEKTLKKADARIIIEAIEDRLDNDAIVHINGFIASVAEYVRENYVEKGLEFPSVYRLTLDEFTEYSYYVYYKRRLAVED